MESLWFGCIPVIIADHYILPLDNFIDWKKAAIIVPERNTVKLLRILRSVPQFQWTRMQFYGRKVGSSRHSVTDYSDYTRSSDAFLELLRCPPLVPYCVMYVLRRPRLTEISEQRLMNG